MVQNSQLTAHSSRVHKTASANYGANSFSNSLRLHTRHLRLQAGAASQTAAFRLRDYYCTQYAASGRTNSLLVAPLVFFWVTFPQLSASEQQHACTSTWRRRVPAEQPPLSSCSTCSGWEGIWPIWRRSYCFPSSSTCPEALQVKRGACEY